MMNNCIMPPQIKVWVTVTPLNNIHSSYVLFQTFPQNFHMYLVKELILQGIFYSLHNLESFVSQVPTNHYGLGAPTCVPCSLLSSL